MLKAIDDANGYVESRIIVVWKTLRFLLTALLRLLFLWHSCCKTLL